MERKLHLCDTTPLYYSPLRFRLVNLNEAYLPLSNQKEQGTFGAGVCRVQGAIFWLYRDSKVSGSEE